MLLIAILAVAAGLEAWRAWQSVQAERRRWVASLVFAVPTLTALAAAVVIVVGTSYLGMRTPARLTRLTVSQVVPWPLLAALAWYWRRVRDQDQHV